MVRAKGLTTGPEKSLDTDWNTYNWNDKVNNERLITENFNHT